MYEDEIMEWFYGYIPAFKKIYLSLKKGYV
jgi:hypothetical protein